MEKHFNAIYFVLYKLDIKFYTFFKKYNPILPLYKIFFTPEKYAKTVVNLDKAMKSPEKGISSWFTGNILVALCYMFCASFVYIVFGILRIPLGINFVYYLLFGIIPFLWVYFLVFKEDKYLDYFKEFNSFSRKQKRALGLKVIFTIFAIIIFLIATIIFVVNRSY